MRAISITAMNQYRKNAKHNNDLPNDVLKARINCLLEASENVYPTIGGTIYKFGSCKIKVDYNDIIISITWANENQNHLRVNLVKCLEILENII